MGESQYTLRRVTESDYEFLYRLKVACLKGYITATWGWDEAYQRAHFKKNFSPERSQIIVMEGVDVGELSVQIEEDEISILGIFIRPGFQRRGLGTDIILDLLKRAQDREAPVRLQVLKVNPARRLYERLGFTIEKSTETHYLMVFR